MELRIQNLSKCYPGGIQALHDVTLTIGQGMFGLLGPNGAGKSTLMRTPCPPGSLRLVLRLSAAAVSCSA